MATNTPPSPSSLFPDGTYWDLRLTHFHSRNHDTYVCTGEDGAELHGLWGLPDIYVIIRDDSHDLIETLNDVILDYRFDAVIHPHQREIEFVFGYLNPSDDPDNSFINRAFTFRYDEHEFHCRYDEPSAQLLVLSRDVKRLPTENANSILRQLAAFRDAQRLPDVPEPVRKYFAGKVPRNFFVSGPFDKVQLPDLFSHINVVVNYYDRKAPMIIIRDGLADDDSPAPHPVRYITGSFPKAVAVRNVDEVLLTLLRAADMNALKNPRTAFLYCFQILEYAGYYYVEELILRRIRIMIRDPAFYRCTDEDIGKLFSAMSEHHLTDDQKMQRMIEECCDLGRVWTEIENDHGFFSTPTQFDGGFVADAIASKDASKTAWCDLGCTKLCSVLTKMRNVIVHSREKRENKVILPTRQNDKLLRRFLPVIRRLAEDVALRH